jgi:branched-chain amino acid transport system permease protein
MSAPSRTPAWMERGSTLLLMIVPLALAGIIINTVGSPLVINIYTFLCVNLVLVLGLQMFMGNSGILAWTYVGFVGIGAFAASILSTDPSLKSMGVPNMYPFLVQLQLPVIPWPLRWPQSSPGRSCACPTPWASSCCSRR